jgi:hypothetical protein
MDSWSRPFLRAAQRVKAVDDAALLVADLASGGGVGG